MIKAGRTEARQGYGARGVGTPASRWQAASEVLDAAFRRVGGVLRVNSDAAGLRHGRSPGQAPRPHGPRLAIVTNAGGPGVLATDALIENRGELATLSALSMEALNSSLPAAWSHGNPIDILGDADPQRYARTLAIATQDPSIDGLLVILTPQAMSDPNGTARELQAYAKVPGKPVLASWMGGAAIEPGEQILDHAGIPTFAYPDAAAQIFTLMWRSYYNLQALYETPSLADGVDRRTTMLAQTAEPIVAAARLRGRTVLTEVESKKIVAAYGIPTVETRVAATEQEAVAAAEAFGFPVVLKLYSFTITHKTDVGGVQLDLSGAKAVRGAFRAIESAVGRHAGPEHFQGVTVQPMVPVDGYELIVGSSLDSPVRPGHSLRRGRPTGRGHKRSRAGLATAEYHPGAAHDGANQDSHGAPRGARPSAGGRGRARATSGPIQPSGRRAARDQGD